MADMGGVATVFTAALSGIHEPVAAQLYTSFRIDQGHRMGPLRPARHSRFLWDSKNPMDNAIGSRNLIFTRVLPIILWDSMCRIAMIMYKS